jgi:type IX secretion system PorP/SprF family membrane protein
MKKIYLALAALSLCALDLHAQQDPHYTQYMYNMNVMNPAYAGSKESISGGLLYRTQWVGIEGAPKTLSFAIHSPVGKNVGLGLSVVSDKVGPVDETNVFGDFSYTLNLGGEHRLALGLKAGASSHKIGLLDEVSPFVLKPDDAFSKNASTVNLNLGTGVFYYTDKYYAAFSIPNMLSGTYLDLTKTDGSTYKFGTTKQHYFLTGGYVFNIADNTKFKPSFMAKSAFGAPMSFDLSANFLFHDKFEVGGTYRKDDSFGAMVNYAVTPMIRVGYAYDYILSDLKGAAPASHEFMLLFDLRTPKKVSISPRFF